MPIQQTFSMNTPDAYEGMVYGLRTAMTIRTVVANAVGPVTPATEAADVMYGAAVQLDAAATKAGMVPVVKNAAASTKNAACYGILVRQINHEAAARPSVDGKMLIAKGDVVGMLVEGEVMVKLKGNAASGDALTYAVAGTWEKGSTPYSNVVALKGGAAGDIVPVRIFSAPVQTAQSQ